MQAILKYSLFIYLMFYACESLIRFGLYKIGADALIFVRDIIIIVPILILFLNQLLKKQLHPAFYIFAFVIGLHGLVMVLNIGNIVTVIYSAKVLITLLFGALAAKVILQPDRQTLWFLGALWVFSIAMVGLDKYFSPFSWVGIGNTNIGGLEVELSRDWEITGVDKRAGGWMRSSINAAIFTSSIGLILLFHAKNIALKGIITFLTLITLYWTTQKGALLGVAMIFPLYMIWSSGSMITMRLAMVFFMILAIAFPIILPHYDMPPSEGQFSLYSFNLRVEMMWPEAWAWIKNNEAFPFGVGLGGIGGGQRFYALDQYNATDNIFLFLYGNFGVMAFLYLGAIVFLSFKLQTQSPQPAANAMAMMAFMMAYGVVLSLIEDQLASIMIGASLAVITGYALENKKERVLSSEQGANI